MRSWNGGKALLLFFLFWEESILCLWHTSSLLLTRECRAAAAAPLGWPQTPAQPALLQSPARFHGISLPQGQNLFLSWSYKRDSLFPFTLYHIKHIPTHRTTPTLLGRKINGEASLDFQRKLIVATLVSVGNSGSSKDSPCVFSQPGSEVMLQGIIILCIRFTPCGCSLKSSYFPLRLKWGFSILICTILSHSMFKTILHCSGE